MKEYNKSQQTRTCHMIIVVQIEEAMRMRANGENFRLNTGNPGWIWLYSSRWSYPWFGSLARVIVKVIRLKRDLFSLARLSCSTASWKIPNVDIDDILPLGNGVSELIVMSMQGPRQWGWGLGSHAGLSSLDSSLPPSWWECCSLSLWWRSKLVSRYWR